MFHGSYTATPTKDGSSGQSTLVHTTPVKWYKVQRKTTTPLKGLNEAVLKLAESVNVEVDLVSPVKTPSKKWSGKITKKSWNMNTYDAFPSPAPLIFNF